MINLLRQKDKHVSLASRDLVFDEVPFEFIPYAAHYDKDTILTKNGELLQVIKITGFSAEMVDSVCDSLREEIRKVIGKHITSDNYSLWFNTIRRPKNLDPSGHYSDEFSYNLNKAWLNKNKWDKKYVNELYITIIRGGLYIKPFSMEALVYSIFHGVVKNKHVTFLKQSCKELTNLVDTILLDLKNFGARKLSLVEENQVIYSEQLEFFGKIINLSDVRVSLPMNDLSYHLSGHKISFGFNTMEVRGSGGKKFAAIFTVKNYQEIPPWALDEFLQLDIEFIITQTIDFISGRSAMEHFDYQKRIFEVSGADKLLERSGIKAIVESDTGSKTDFGNSQITILFIADSVEHLATTLDKAMESLDELGILVTRRDLRLEECFWAQLPANFSHITRARPIAKAQLGGFASLYNFPAGKNSGNHWGTAVTAFYTAAGTPYFFNFHVDKVGHTLIIGPAKTGKTTLVNFLLTEARKYNYKLFFFDQMRASKVFIKALNGKYTVIKPDVPNPEHAFNPLLLLEKNNDENNKKFLAYWLALLITASGELEISDDQYYILSESLNYITSLSSEQRNLRNISAFLKQRGENAMAEKLSPWMSGEKYGHLFDNRTDCASFEGVIYGFGMSYVIESEVCLGPVLAYLLYKIEMVLDGTPTIIVLEEAWKLVDNYIFASRLEVLLQRLAEKNAMVIFSTQNLNDASKSEITSTLINNIATQIFMPNPSANESINTYKNIWGMSDKEFEMLKVITTEKREFLLRQQDHTIIASLNLNGFKELEVLAGGDDKVELMEKAIEQKGDNVSEWISLFYDLVRSSKR